MFAFLIQSLVMTLAAIGVFTTLVVIAIAITKDTFDLPPKQYALLVTWIFLAALAINGLILAYHQHK